MASDSVLKNPSESASVTSPELPINIVSLDEARLEHVSLSSPRSMDEFDADIRSGIPESAAAEVSHA